MSSLRQEVLGSVKRIVVKIGSRLLAPKGRGLQTAWIEQLARDVAALHGRGCDVLIVSSGAIAAGIERLGLAERPTTIARKQAAAAVGQGRLMAAYDAAFSSAGLTVAQVLLTHGDLADRKRFLNARTTLTTLLAAGVVPVMSSSARPVPACPTTAIPFPSSSSCARPWRTTSWSSTRITRMGSGGVSELTAPPLRA